MNYVANTVNFVNGVVHLTLVVVAAISLVLASVVTSSFDQMLWRLSQTSSNNTCPIIFQFSASSFVFTVSISSCIGLPVGPSVASMISYWIYFESTIREWQCGFSVRPVMEPVFSFVMDKINFVHILGEVWIMLLFNINCQSEPQMGRCSSGRSNIPIHWTGKRFSASFCRYYSWWLWLIAFMNFVVQWWSWYKISANGEVARLQEVISLKKINNILWCIKWKNSKQKPVYFCWSNFTESRLMMAG